MSDMLRRAYNSIERLFDIHAISQKLRYSRGDGESKLPKTAFQAFQSIHPLTHTLDRQARLKMIVSQQGVNISGTSSHWEFFFDLPRRRAQVVCEWVLFSGESADEYQRAGIEITVNPFPPANSPIRQAVRQGKMHHQQMVGMWKQECLRRPNLPTNFRDSDIALADFVKQGLDITQAEFSLCTGQFPQGTPCWIAQTRNAAYYSTFV
jgi:hypothetical protein